MWHPKVSAVNWKCQKSIGNGGASIQVQGVARLSNVSFAKSTNVGFSPMVQYLYISVGAKSTSWV